MESFIYLLTFGCFLLYFMGIIKRQVLLHQKVIKFNLWHAIFTVSTIPVSLALIYRLLDESVALTYTLWIPILCFHVCNVVDLNTHIPLKDKR